MAYRLVQPAMEPDVPLRKLGALACLSEEDFSLLSHVLSEARPVPARQEVTLQDYDIAPPALLVSGWACGVRWLSNGRRQIVSIYVPGDMLGLPRGSGSIVAVTDASIADGRLLQDAVVADRWRGLGLACLRAEALEYICMVDHIVRLGRQSAFERTAHFILELHARLRLACIIESDRFYMPLTQEILADSLGLSNVHMNRTLQGLRRQGMVELHNGHVALPQREKLARLVCYEDPVERSLLVASPAPATTGRRVISG